MRSWVHHRSDALTGEELEQQRVREAAVEDVRASHAVACSADTHDSILGIMPSETLPVGDQLLHARRTSMREISEPSSGQSP